MSAEPVAVSPETVPSVRPAAVSPRAGVATRLARAEVALGAMIVVSIVGRILAALPHSTPRLFPDEYIYSALARAITHGRSRSLASAAPRMRLPRPRSRCIQITSCSEA